jgi:DNA-directed RNA polymerase specialized sigma24 family protein
LSDPEAVERLLDRTNRLLALQLVRGLPLREQVLALDFAGFSPREIAAVIRKTPNHVSVILHEERKKAGKEVGDGERTGNVDVGTPSSDDGVQQNVVQKVL